MALAPLQIPTFDLTHLQGNRRSLLLLELARACREWGCFQVENHGVSREVVDGMWAAARCFYEQPMVVKQRLQSLEREKGVTFRKSEETNRAYWLEILTIRHRPGICDGFQEASEILGEILHEFRRNMENLGNNLYSLIFESLGFDAEYMKAAAILRTIERAVLTLNFYPVCPDPSKQMGFKQHSDVGTLTLIMQDEVGGLQALSNTGEWVAITKHTPNTILVLRGDQLEILTNGRYKACVHRVMTNCEELRASMPFTFGPHEEDLVAPLTRLLDHENPPLYQGVVFQDYMARAFNLNLPDSQKGLNFARAPSMSYSIPFAK